MLPCREASSPTRYAGDMRVPDFLVKQFYVAGSLQREGDGFRLQARNGMSDGTLVKIGSIKVDGVLIDAANITATRVGDDTVHQAADVSPASPVAFRKGDVVTFHIADHPLPPGEHRFDVEIYEVNVGQLVLSLKDRVA
jgi:hypothetical protein